MSALLERLIEDAVRAARHEEELAIEAAVAGGVHGVSCIVHADGHPRCQPDENVPYGQLFSFPSFTAYDNWFGIGCPTEQDTL